MADKQIPVILKFLLDKGSIEGIKTGTMSVEQGFNKLEMTLIRNQNALIDISASMKKVEAQSKRMFVGSVAFISGIVAFSNNYVKNLDETNDLTRQWEASSKKVEEAQARIGKVTAQEVLPLYEKAATIVDQIAGFVENNPEVVKAAINTGLFVAGFSALSIAVSKGIKFVADATYIATSAAQLLASKNMQDAANKQLLASTKLGGGEIAQDLRKSFGLASAGAAGLSAGQFAAAAAGFTAINFGMVGVIEVSERLVENFTKSATAGSIFGNAMSVIITQIPGYTAVQSLRNFFDTIQNSMNILETTNKKMGKSTLMLSGSDYEKQIVDAYTQMIEDDLAAQQQFNIDKKNITEKANNDLIKAALNNASAIKSINASYEANVKSITANYLKQSKASEIAYANQRAQTIRNSGIEIQRIEEDLQEKLIKLREDHERNMEGLVAKRDAFGLKKEIQAYNDKRDEEIANTNKEIARRSQDLAQRLSDMDAEHRAERAMRYEEYKASLEEARIQRDEQLKIQQEKYKEEQQQIKDNKRIQLTELQNNFNDEKKRRLEGFIRMVKDLDASLFGEAELKKQYYALMLRDAEAFFRQYRRTLSAGTSTSSGEKPATGWTKDTGGYMMKGIYENKNGIPEMVMNGTTTRMAEAQMGYLTQEKLQGLFSGGNKKIVINEGNKRFDSRISKADRRAIQQDIIETFKGLVK